MAADYAMHEPETQQEDPSSDFDSVWDEENQQSWGSKGSKDTWVEAPWRSWASNDAWGNGPWKRWASDDFWGHCPRCREREDSHNWASKDTWGEDNRRSWANKDVWSYSQWSKDDREDVAAEKNAKKQKQKRSSKPGAHKQWLQEKMLPDDYTSENPKWSYWSGKNGWSGFAKSSWAFLDDLHCQATENGEACTGLLEIGGWSYEITIDPNMKDEDYPEACGYQVAQHSNSNMKKRLIRKSF